MKPAQWIAPLDEKSQARLRGMLAKLTGPAGKTARWIMEDKGRWARLCGIADLYANDEPMTENWKDAGGQWRAVHDAAQALNEALAGLGELASNVRQFEKVRAIGQWKTVAPWLHPVPGEAFAPPVHDLEWFAKVAAEECKAQADAHGAGRGTDGDLVPFLLRQVCDLIEYPRRGALHARRIALVLHVWATEKGTITTLEKVNDTNLEWFRDAEEQIRPYLSMLRQRGK